MSLRFLLDEDISYRVAEGLRQRGFDAISVHEIGRADQGIVDADQLAFAALNGRVLVTYNRGDFQALDLEWREIGRRHAGILWCTDSSIPRHAFGELIRTLSAMTSVYDSLEDICMPLPRAAGSP